MARFYPWNVKIFQAFIHREFDTFFFKIGIMGAMTDELREYLRPSAFEVLEYFSSADLQRRLEKDGCTKNMVSKVLNGFRTNQKTVREIAELPAEKAQLDWINSI